MTSRSRPNIVKQGIVAHYVPKYLQKNRLPSWETNLLRKFRWFYPTSVLNQIDNVDFFVGDMKNVENAITSNACNGVKPIKPFLIKDLILINPTVSLIKKGKFLTTTFRTVVSSVANNLFSRFFKVIVKNIFKFTFLNF